MDMLRIIVESRCMLHYDKIAQINFLTDPLIEALKNLKLWNLLFRSTLGAKKRNFLCYIRLDEGQILLNMAVATWKLYKILDFVKFS